VEKKLAVGNRLITLAWQIACHRFCKGPRREERTVSGSLRFQKDSERRDQRESSVFCFLCLMTGRLIAKILYRRSLDHDVFTFARWTVLCGTTLSLIEHKHLNKRERESHRDTLTYFSLFASFKFFEVFHSGTLLNCCFLFALLDLTFCSKKVNAK
jgi:hypothetical protein